MKHVSTTTVLHHVQRLLDRPSNGVSDGALLQRFVENRDEAAFELLLWRHQRMVFSVCCKILMNHADAEDAFQATFLVLARKAGTIQHKSSVAGWLYQVAYRTALRLRSSVAKRNANEASDDQLAVASDKCAEPAQVAADRETAKIVHQEIERMPEKYRTPVVLCYLEGKSCSETAHELGEPRGTIATRLAHARKVLRSRLGKRGLAFSALIAVLQGSSSAAVAAPTLARTVGSVVAGKAIASCFSQRVSTLTTGVLRDMFISKCKTIAFIALTLTLFLGGVWSYMRPLTANEPVTQSANLQKDQAKQPKTDQQRLQGKWLGEKFEINNNVKGPQLPIPELFTLTFKNDKVTMELGDEKETGTLRLDVKQNPKHIDFDLGPKKGMKGIYKFDGDRLVLCAVDHFQQRPTSFKPKDREGLLVFRRAGAKDKKRNPEDAQLIRKLKQRLVEIYKEYQKLQSELGRSKAMGAQNKARIEFARKYIICRIKKIDIGKNTITVTIRDTTLEVQNIPIADNAKFKMGGKNCEINDYKPGMMGVIRVETRDGRSQVVEINAGSPKKK